MSLRRMSLIQTITCLVLLSGLVSSVDLDWLNEVNPNLENVFKEMTKNEKQFKTTVLKQKNLYEFHFRFWQFLDKTTKLMVNSYKDSPFYFEAAKTGLRSRNEYEYKELVKESYNRLLFAIQLIRSRVEILNQKQVLKDFYEQDLADFSQLILLLEKTKDRFKRHVDTIYDIKAADETNDVNLDNTLVKNNYDLESRNRDYIDLIGTALHKANQLRENNRKLFLSDKTKKRTPESNIKWLYEINPEFDASLQTFIDDKTGFIQDVVNRVSLERHYLKLLDFLEETRRKMNLMRTEFPFEVTEHVYHYKVLTNKGNEVDFKKLSSECYHRLKAANQWILERLVVLRVYIVMINNYEGQLNTLSDHLEFARTRVESYLKNLYDIEAAYKSESSSREKQKLIESFEQNTRKRFFLRYINVVILNLKRYINSISKEKGEESKEIFQISSDELYYGEQDDDIGEMSDLNN